MFKRVQETMYEFMLRQPDKLVYHIEDQPMSFAESLNKLHSSEPSCPLCKWATDFVAKRYNIQPVQIPWMAERNIPLCAWALGCYLTKTFDLDPQAIGPRGYSERVYKGGSMKLNMIMMQRRKGMRYAINIETITHTNIIPDHVLKKWGISLRIFEGNCPSFVLQTLDLYKYTVVNRDYLFEKVPVKVEPKTIEPKVENGEPKSKNKKSSGKKGKKSNPKPRSKPRISRTTKCNTKNDDKQADDESVQSNKYNKRFTKTKKPAKL